MPPLAARLAGLIALALVALPHAAAAAAPPAVAVEAQVSVENGVSRLVLTASRETEASSFVLEGPDRIVVELPGLHCRLPAESGRRGAGLIGGFRCGLFAIGRTRLILDLSSPALVKSLVWSEGPFPEARRLTIELSRTDREGFRLAGRRAHDPDSTGSIGRPAGDATKPLVAIDAGHGGVDSGAIATTGHYEKDVVLAYARELRDAIAASGRARVIMIRDADVFVPLDERVRIARSAGAELFVSIHGDSMSNPTGRGATIYTGAERATDVESAKLAERENAADGKAGAVPSEVRAGISDILSDLTLRETRGLSHRFAAQLQSQLSPVMQFSPQPHREAGFRVLRAPDMTSVLVELGYLSNAKDASLLLSDDWRRRSAAAMAEAVGRFFAARPDARAAVSP